MSWALIDDKVLTHPKMQRAEAIEGDAAWVLWSKALVYVRLHQLDGVVPGDMLSLFVRHENPSKVAATLVRVGLWHVHGEDFQFHDYHDINDTKDQVEAKREEARERMRRRRGVRANNGEQPANKSEQPEPVRGSSEGVRDPEPYRTEPKQTEPNQTKVKKPRAHEPADCAQETPALPAPQATANPDAAKILDRIRTHPELAPIASVALAERLAGLRLTGKTLEAILLSVDELADKATAAALAGAPWNAEHMGGRALAFGRNASGQRPRGRDSPKVQTGETDWSKEADVVGGSEANR